MPREIVALNLLRNSGEPWGFRIIGGTDEARILKVDKVSSIACIAKDYTDSHKELKMNTFFVMVGPKNF